MVFCYFGKGLPQFFTIIVLVILGIVNGREAKCQVVKIMGPESLRSSPAPLISYGTLDKLFSLSILWFSQQLMRTVTLWIFLRINCIIQ